MSALVTEHLPLLASAPEGIKKLRGLILELAVRGKLVPQDPNDEPAGELLKRIANEKARLLAEGRLNKQRSLNPIDCDDAPFELPCGWCWARLSDVVNVLNGRAYKKEELLDAGTPVLRVGNLFTSKHWYYSDLVLDDDKYCNPGDLLFAWSASFGPFIWSGERSIYHYHIWKLDFYDQGSIDKYFLYNYLLEQTQVIKASGHGVSMVHMTKEKMERLVIPFPPLSEQQRIVAKVDELMALCDRLEAQQDDAAAAHAQLMQTLLNSLTRAQDADDFAASWQRISTHFDVLFTTEASIDALKQTTLQLAVMGKLVPQDPNDEPASELLKRIQCSRVTKKRRIKCVSTEISQQEKPFDLPDGWCWGLLPDLGELARGKSRHRPRNDPALYAGGKFPLIQTGDVARADGVVRTYSSLYNSMGVEQSRLWPAGTLCITIAANIADSAVLGFDACFPDSVVGFIPYFPDMDVRYFDFLIRVTKSHLENFAPSTAQKNINLEILGELLVPVPPVNELCRIVAKVDELMALCDQLKTQLSTARKLQEKLAGALVEQAVA